MRGCAPLPAGSRWHLCRRVDDGWLSNSDLDRSADAAAHPQPSVFAGHGVGTATVREWRPAPRGRPRPSLVPGATPYRILERDARRRRASWAPASAEPPVDIGKLSIRVALAPAANRTRGRWSALRLGFPSSGVARDPSGRPRRDLSVLDAESLRLVTPATAHPRGRGFLESERAQGQVIVVRDPGAAGLAEPVAARRASIGPS